MLHAVMDALTVQPAMWGLGASLLGAQGRMALTHLRVHLYGERGCSLSFMAALKAALSPRLFKYLPSFYIAVSFVLAEQKKRRQLVLWQFMSFSG